MLRRELSAIALLLLTHGCSGELMEHGDGGMRDSGELDASGASDARNDTAISDDGGTDTGTNADAGQDSGQDASLDARERDASPGECGVARDGGTFALMVDGRERRYELDLPPDYEGREALPLVIAFHGRNSNIAQQRLVSGLSELGATEGFAVAYPAGVGDTWNGGLCCGAAMSAGVDDVAFITEMLDRIEREYCIDRQRVFATGLSNGAFMAHRLACEASERIAAIAPVAGMNLYGACDPAEPVAVLHFHGDSDRIVSYDGYLGFYSVEDSMRDWAEANECDGPSEETRRLGEVRCEAFRGCTRATELCTVEGGGHQWPGGQDIPFLGHNTDDISASEAMWAFFEAHPKSR